jgi:hypothetical protein
VGWHRIKGVAENTESSSRTVHRWLKDGLRHSKVHGTIFISDEALAEWFKRHEVQVDEVAEIVDQVMADI